MKRQIALSARGLGLVALSLVVTSVHSQDFPLGNYVFGSIPVVTAALPSRTDERTAASESPTAKRAAPAPRQSIEYENTRPAEICAGLSAMERQEAMALVEAIAAEERYDVKFALAVAKQESRFVSNIRSPRGAYGLMQLMPATAADLKVDPCVPAENVRGGIRYLRQLEAEFKNPIYVLSAYNAGPRRVAENGGVPPIHETINYVASILNDYHGWPEARRGGRPGRAPPSTPIKPDKPEDDGTQRSVAAHPARADATSWKSGFVMNFD